MDTKNTGPIAEGSTLGSDCSGFLGIPSGGPAELTKNLVSSVGFFCGKKNWELDLRRRLTLGSGSHKNYSRFPLRPGVEITRENSRSAR